MPMPVLQFQGQGAGLGWLRGAAAGQDLVNKLFSAPVQQQLLAQQLAEKQEALRQAQLAGQFQEDTIKSRLAKEAAQTGLFGAQIPGTEAKTELTKEQTRLMPTQAAIKAYQATLKAAGLAPGSSYAGARNLNSLVRWLNTAQGAEFTAKNPEIAEDIMRGAALSAQKLSQTDEQKTMPVLPEILKQTLGITDPLAQPEDQPPARPPIEITPEQIKGFQEMSGDVATKKTSTANLLRQRTAGLLADNLIDASIPNMEKSVEFAGLMGKAKLSADKMGAVLGTDDPRYRAWLQFTNQQLPAIANELRKEMGGQATDKENEILDKIVNPDYWASNPELARDQFFNLIEISRTMAGVVSKGLTDQRTELEKKSKPLVVPTFSDASKFDSWYKGLSNIKKFEYRQRLKNKGDK